MAHFQNTLNSYEVRQSLDEEDFPDVLNRLEIHPEFKESQLMRSDIKQNVSMRSGVMISVKIEYRPPTVVEYNELRGLVGWWQNEPTAIEMAMKNSLFSVVCTVHGSAVGFGRIIGDGLYYYIQDLIIHPDYQSKGLGRTLMKELIYYISTNAKAGSFIGLIAAQGLEKYYEQFGFKAREKNAPGMFQIVK